MRLGRACPCEHDDVRWRSRRLLLGRSDARRGRGCARGPARPVPLLDQLLHENLGDLQLRQVALGDTLHRRDRLPHPRLVHRSPPLRVRSGPADQQRRRPRSCVLGGALGVEPSLLRGVLRVLLAKPPGQRHRQSKAAERPALRAGERRPHELSDAQGRVGGDRGRVLPADRLPSGEELVEGQRHRLVELVALSAPLHVEPRRIALWRIPGPVLPVLGGGSRVSVSAGWDTGVRAVENLWRPGPGEAEQRARPALQDVGRQRGHQRGVGRPVGPPAGVDDLVAPGVAALRVGPAHDQPALQQIAHAAVHRGPPQPGTLGEDAHGEGYAVEPKALVRPQDRPEQLVEDRPRPRAQAHPRDGAREHARQPRVVEAAGPFKGGLSRDHGGARGEVCWPLCRCCPRAMDVP